MENEIILPFGDMEIIITPTVPMSDKKFGYRLTLRKPGYKDTEALYLKGAIDCIAGNQYQSNIAVIPADFEDPTIAYVHGLLSPTNRPSVIQREDGSLYCTKCHCQVPNTANHEMRKEGAYAHSHICGIKSRDEVYE